MGTFRPLARRVLLLTSLCLALVALIVSACSTAPRGDAGSRPPVTTGNSRAEAAASPKAVIPGESDVDGSKCVLILAATEPEGLRAEGKWLHEHWPGWRRTQQSTGFGKGGAVYDSLDVVTPDGARHSVCFDISSWYGKY